jgi:hypothetical protein
MGGGGDRLPTYEVVDIGDTRYPRGVPPDFDLGSTEPEEVANRPFGFAGARTALAKTDCYRMFGFSSGSAAQKAFDSLTFQWQRLGALQVEPTADGRWKTAAGTPTPAQNDPGGSNTIVINSDFNWLDFSSTPAVNITTGQPVPGGFNYLSGVNNALNTNMTTGQLSSLILLHEFRHTAAGGNQASEPNNQLVHDNCIR